MGHEKMKKWMGKICGNGIKKVVDDDRWSTIE
jgi:hypothetical protein